MKRLWIILVCLLSTIAADSIDGRAQRLYDKTRDDEAQAAAKIAGDLQSGTLFDKQLKNLSILSKRDMEASLTSARVRMRADINSFTTWEDVDTVVCAVNQRITRVNDLTKEKIKHELEELAGKIKDAKAAFDAMKREAECKKAGSENVDVEKCPEQKPGQLAAFFEHAGELEDISVALDSLRGSFEKGKNVSAAVGRANDVLDALKTLYDKFRARMDDYNKLQGELLDLQLPLKKIALQALQTDEQHLKNILKIRARREAEEANILEMIDEYAEQRHPGEALPCAGQTAADMTSQPGRRKPRSTNIEMELRDLVAKLKSHETALDKAKVEIAEAEIAKNEAALARANENDKRFTISAERLRDELSSKLFTLHVAAAISARGELPAKLADLREAQEGHAYSIRKSAVMARGYEATVTSGVKRLALYHKGGIKPSVVAQLIHSAATVAIPPVLAAK